MWPDRRLVELFEIEHPIVLAPMAGFGTVELAAAVADANRVGLRDRFLGRGYSGFPITPG
jgi:NAD(P)H-dependent flavin oxidoreductase YrpB (nitropropane dioxygenase family)